MGSSVKPFYTLGYDLPPFEQDLAKRLSLRARDTEDMNTVAQQTYLRSCGLVYMGELTRVQFPKNRKKSVSQIIIEALLESLELEFGLDLDQAGWLPPYAQEEAIREAWAMPLTQMFGGQIPWRWMRERCEKKSATHTWELLTGHFLEGRPGNMREVTNFFRCAAKEGGSPTVKILRGGMYVPPQYRVKP